MNEKILIAVLSLLFSPRIYASENNVIYDLEKEEKQEAIEEDYYHVSFDFGDETICGKSLSFTISFDFPTAPTIESSGDISLSVLSGNETEIEFSAMLPEKDAEVEIIFSFNEEEERRALYSTYDGEERYALSVFSLYSAKKLLGILPDQEFMDNDLIEAEYQAPVSETNTTSIRKESAKGSVYGFIFWLDDYSGKHPLCGAKIKLTFAGNKERACYTYTDSTGHFNLRFSGIEFNGTYECTLHIYAENQMIIVTDKSGQVYEKAIVLSNMQNNTDYNLGSRTLNVADGTFVEAIQIFSAGKRYSDYARTLTEHIIDQCTIIYPSGKNGCSYSDVYNTIKIADKQYTRVGYPAPYASWDVIGHEYGHHLQNKYFLQDYSGSHNYYKNSIFEYFETEKEKNSSYTITDEELAIAKDAAAKLSFGEAWATFFSISAQYFFDTDTQKIYTVGDSVYTSYKGISQSLEVRTNSNGKTGQCNGDTDELIIMSFLYQLWDYDNNLTNDKLSIPDFDLWKVMVDNNPKNLGEFVSVLYNSGISFSRENLGLLLEEFKLSADGLYTMPEILNHNTLPTFYWNANGTKVIFDNFTYNYDNDKFRLSFYDENKNLILTTSMITGTSYSPTIDEWAEIFATEGDAYYVVIESYASLGYQTGPYYSQFYSFLKPTNVIIGKLNPDIFNQRVV